MKTTIQLDTSNIYHLSDYLSRMNVMTSSEGAGHDAHAEFSAMGIFALVCDGAEVGQIAAALNTTCQNVKRHLVQAVNDLSARTSVAMQDVTPGNSKKAVPVLVQKISNHHGFSWLDMLVEREHVEVIETRAYFRAFRNSHLVVNGDMLCQNTI